MESRRPYTAMGLGAIVLWASTVGVGRSITRELGPLTAGALAFLIAGIGGMVISGVASRGAARRARGGQWLVRGGLFVAYEGCVYLALGWAVDDAQALELGLVNYLWPALTVLGVVALLGVRARWWLGPSVAVATAGVMLAMTQGAEVSWRTVAQHAAGNPGAYVIMLAAAVSWALYSVLTRKWAAGDDGRSILEFLLLTGVVLGATRLVVGEESVWSWGAAGELAFMAIGPNVGYVLWEEAMRRGDVAVVVSASYLTPLLSTLIACVYLQVAAGWALWAGAVLVVAGAVACRTAMGAPVGATPAVFVDSNAEER